MRITALHTKGKPLTTLFYNNIFYKNINAKSFEILEHFKIKPEAVILKRFEF